MTESSGLRTTVEDGTLLVELNRPEKHNVLDEAVQGELLRVFADAASDREVRSVILTGSGEAFSAGGDLSRFERDWDPAEFRAQSHELTRLISSVERLEKPVVAAINGLATGAASSSGGRRRLTASRNGCCSSRPVWTWRAACSPRAWRRVC